MREFFKPEKKRIAIFATFMIILLGGVASCRHAQGNITLSNQIYPLLDSLHLVNSLDFLSSPLLMFAVLILKINVASVNHATPFFIAVYMAYFYGLSCLAAYLWEKKDSNTLKELLRPDKKRIAALALLEIVTFILPPPNAGIWPIEDVIHRCFPLTLDQTFGTILIMTLPAMFLFDYLIAGIIIITGYNTEMLIHLEFVYTLLIILNLYVLGGMAAYAWKNRKNKKVVLVAAVYLLFIIVTPWLFNTL